MQRASNYISVVRSYNSAVERRTICPLNYEKGKMANFTSFSTHFAWKSLVKISITFSSHLCTIIWRFNRKTRCPSFQFCSADRQLHKDWKWSMPFSNLFVGIELTRLSGDGLGLVSLIHNIMVMEFQATKSMICQ